MVPAPGPALERERAAEGLRALAQRGEADVARAHARRGDPGIEADAVVAHADAVGGSVVLEHDRDVRGMRVARDVREQLARAAEHRAVVRAGRALGQVERQLEACARRRGAGVLPDRRREPGLLEQVRVKIGDRSAQLGHRRRDRRVRACLRPVRRRPGRHVEVVAGREQVLDRAVVQILRQLPALPLLGRQRLGDEPLALCREHAYRRVAARQQQRQQRHREAEPGQVGGLHEHERERAAARSARVRRRLQHVHDRRRGGDRGRHERSPAEGDGDDREQEREAQLREAAARAVGERPGERRCPRWPSSARRA